jgi:hypothetical protein
VDLNSNIIAEELSEVLAQREVFKGDSRYVLHPTSPAGFNKNAK